MSERCEWTRDRLPELVAGALEAADAAQVRAHVGGCAECAGELELVQLLRADEVTVPAGLEGRVRRALAAAPGRAWRRVFTPARLAIAATIVLALVTASLLDGPGGPLATLDRPAPTVDAGGEALAPPPWPSADEPLMRGAPALYQLSVEELESLLKELES